MIFAKPTQILFDQGWMIERETSLRIACWRSRTKAVIIIILKLAIAVSEPFSINLSISNHLFEGYEGEKPYIS